MVRRHQLLSVSLRVSPTLSVISSFLVRPSQATASFSPTLVTVVHLQTKITADL